MKFCVLGDLHFGARGDSKEFYDYFELFFSEVLFPYLIREKINVIVQLGDLFERRKYINFNTLYLARNLFFENLKKNDISLITILGNHDIFFKNTVEINSPSLLLESYKGCVTIISEFTTINLGGMNFDFIPWVCQENIDSIKENILNSSSEYCFGHFELDGGEISKGSFFSGGCLNSEVLKKYKKVYSGHFHINSILNNVEFVGTPYELTWSDFDIDKKFLIFDTDSYIDIYVKNRFSIFKKIYFDDENFNSEYFENLDLSVYSNCYVKVVILNKKDDELYEKFMNRLYNASPYDINVIEKSEGSVNDESDVTVEVEDTIHIFNKTIEFSDTNLNKNKLKLLINEVYTEACDIRKVN